MQVDLDKLFYVCMVKKSHFNMSGFCGLLWKIWEFLKPGSETSRCAVKVWTIVKPKINFTLVVEMDKVLFLFLNLCNVFGIYFL